MSTPKGAKAPRIVAELGRPETPEETAARKAQNSRNHRANQTMRNLIYSLIATLILVLVIVAVVVRPAPEESPAIDYHAIAADSQVSSSIPLVDPNLPPSFTSNSAELTNSADGVSTWYIGLITPTDEFIGVTQGINANPTWVSQQLEERTPTGTETIDGRIWDVYDHRDEKDPGNLAYAMVATFAGVEPGDDTTGQVSANGTSYILFGTADSNEFRTVAASVGTELTEAETAQPDGAGE